MTERTRCVVVGGGPAGMVLGLLLARAGVEVTVLEKHADFLRDFRGDTVHPTTLQLMDELGLGEAFGQLPQSHMERVLFPQPDGTSVVLGDFSRLHLSHPYIAMVPQWDFLDLLAAAARREPTFTLRSSTEATGLLWEGSRVVGVSVATADDVDEMRADLVVACDGRFSVLRRESGLPLREFRVPIDAWWFRLPRYASDQVEGLMPVAGIGRFAVVIPRPEYFQVAYIGAKGSDASLRGAGLESFRRNVAELIPFLADRVDALESMDDVKMLSIQVNRLRRWHLDGLLCIGDAAHAMSPIGGVGVNLAVQDGVAAASLLASSLRRGRVPVRRLARVRRRRLLPTVAVQTLQLALHKALVGPVLTGQRVGPPAAMVEMMRRVPLLRLVPAYLIGVGLRPEHAPPFARRPPSGTMEEWPDGSRPTPVSH